MKHTLLLLCFAAASHGQALPLSWPDRPEGLVLGSLQAMRYDGSSTPAGPGAMIIAWCDARDGDGRVALQKVTGLDPTGPGLWHTPQGEWGLAEGLLLPRVSGQPLLPWVVSDGQGGAIAVWQDLESETTSALRACRAGDGPQGQGAPLWPEPVTISTDVFMDVGDCRDMRTERCRSIDYDGSKAVCSDDAGGAWILWRTGSYQLRLQHLSPDGTLDPDLPTQGLELAAPAYTFNLASDGTGNAVVCWREPLESGHLSPLLVQAIQPDGSLTLPGGPLAVSLPDDAPQDCRLQTVGDGQVLIAWTGLPSGAPEYQVMVQLIDAHMAPQYVNGGLAIGAFDGFSALRTACAGADGPVYLSYGHAGMSMAQRLALSGELEWGAGVSLDLVGDHEQISCAAIAPLGNGLGCLLGDYSPGQCLNPLCLVKLDELGAPVWPESQTLMAHTCYDGPPTALQPDGQGGLLCAWQNLNDLSMGLFVQHRTADAADLVPADLRLLRLSRNGYVSQVQVLPDDPQPLAFWTSYNGLFMQAVDPVTGAPLLGAGGLEPAIGAVMQDFQACPDGAGGAWLTVRRPDASMGGTLDLVHLGAAGEVLLAGTPVAPGSIAIPSFYGHGEARVVTGTGRVFVIFEQIGQIGQTQELRAQAFDPQGVALWGDLGRVIFAPASGLSACLTSAVPDGLGGVLLTWTEYLDWMNLRAFLQRMDADGNLLVDDNQGRGTCYSTAYYPSVDQIRFAELPQGGWGLLWSEQYRMNGGNTAPALFLAGVALDGHLSWSHMICECTSTAFDLLVTPTGDLAVANHEFHEDFSRDRLHHYSADGALLREWAGASAQVVWAQRLNLLRGDDHPGMVSASYYSDGNTPCGLSGQSPSETDSLLVMDYCGLPVLQPLACYTMDLAADAGGGVWYAWNDGRSSYNAYGNQVRLLKLSPVNDAVDPGGVNRPGLIRLAQNQPNPFNPETWIIFELGRGGPAQVEVFNLAGQRVRLLQDGALPAGLHRLRFDARDDKGLPLSSGLYLYRVSAGGESRVERMLLLR